MRKLEENQDSASQRLTRKQRVEMHDDFVVGGTMVGQTGFCCATKLVAPIIYVNVADKQYSPSLLLKTYFHVENLAPSDGIILLHQPDINCQPPQLTVLHFSNLPIIHSDKIYTEHVKNFSNHICDDLSYILYILVYGYLL